MINGIIVINIGCMSVALLYGKFVTEKNKHTLLV